jgi:hypothetical protein
VGPRASVLTGRPSPRQCGDDHTTGPTGHPGARRLWMDDHRSGTKAPAAEAARALVTQPPGFDRNAGNDPGWTRTCTCTASLLSADHSDRLDERPPEIDHRFYALG